MNSLTTIVIVAMFISTAIAVLMTVYAWRRLSTPGMWAFGLMTAGLAWWTLFYMGEILLPDLSLKVWMARFEYIGIGALPYGWALFSATYTGRDKWLTRPWQLGLSVIPILTVLLIFTNDFHHLIYVSVKLNENGPLSVIDATYGMMWYVNFAYSYVLMAAGTVLLIIGIFSIPRAYWFQQALLLLSPILPWVANALYVLRISPIPQLDASPLAFTISALILATDIFRFGLFDIAPVARSAVVDHMHIAALVVDNKNRVVDINPAAARLIGSQSAETLGRPIEQVLQRWPAFVERFETVVEANEEITVPTERMQYHYRIQINPIYNRSNRVTGRLVMITDITKDKLAEQALTMSQVRTEFLGKISQSLQTPLNGVLATAETLQSGVYGTLNHQQERSVQQIVERVQHVSQLLADVLQHAQLDTGQLTLENKEFSPERLLEQVHETFDLAARRKSLWLRMEILPEVPSHMMGDFMRLFQVLSNLTDNAIKFTHSGGVKIRVSIPTPGRWALEVIDTGIGIPEEHRQYIFNAFQKTNFNVASDAGGIGLGLAIVKQLVDAMQGTIQLAASDENGTTMRVVLPLHEAERKTPDLRLMF